MSGRGGRGEGRGSAPGRGRQGGPKAAGAGGECVCPQCGKIVEHQVGVPCNQQNCPECGTRMVRK
ncbi:MAG: hypothetical protein R6U96_06570 [Promethearchaeia archaeon]